jgi:uncharacterized membrane protein YdbT with pleckstrin-like domain
VTFPRRLLTEGEEVVVDLRPHWAFLGWPLVATVAAVALAVGIVVAFPHAPVGVVDALGGLAVAAGLWLAGRALRWITTSLVLTTTRIVERSGVLGRRTLEIRLDRINQLSSHQSLPGRVARTGEVMVEVGGETGVVTFEHVRRPFAFQSLITEQMSAFGDTRRAHLDAAVAGEGPGAAPHADTPATGTPAVPREAPPGASGTVAAGAPPAAAPSAAERLMQLGELRRRGIVSAAEFEAKKAELLEQL